MSKINLIHLIKDKNLGGSTTYLVHLYEALTSIGMAVKLFKLKKSTGIQKANFYYHINGFKIDIKPLVSYLNKNKEKSIITYCFWKEYKNECKILMKYCNSAIFVHDPAEFHDDFIEYAIANKIIVYTIRKSNQEALTKLGIESVFIPHLFITNNVPTTTIKNKLACSIARIDFRKHTDVIIKANIGNDLVDIYGEVNRLMDYHKLMKIDSNWRRNYKGKIDEVFNLQVSIASEYKYFIDLTNIQGDGGGTQYSFFEAMNARCYLILNRKWVAKEGSIFKEGVNCLCAETPEEILDILNTGKTYDLSQNDLILKNHTKEKVLTIFKQNSLI
jgi:hypothetical protein